MQTLCSSRGSMLQGQVKRIQVLERNREEVRPVKVIHGESGYVHTTNGCVTSFVVTQDPGFLGVPSVWSGRVTECVGDECAEMEWNGERESVR